MNVVESEEARRDVLETYHYIAIDSVTAAERWLDSILLKYEMLAENPLIGRARPEFQPDLRSYVVGSYIIFYRPLAAGVEIMRVVHGARDLDSIFETG